jgi:hypothetical protein
MTRMALPLAAILMTAVALIPGGAHLFALPNKLTLDREAYFTVQAIYLGWWKLGLVLIAALIADLGLVLRLRGRSPAFWLALLALALVACNLAIFFGWTFPANRATNDWTVVPTDWERLRREWEYSHALNALLTFVSLVCVTSAGLCHPAASPPGKAPGSSSSL